MIETTFSEKYFSFSGRLNRIRFFLRMLFIRVAGALIIAGLVFVGLLLGLFGFVVIGFAIVVSVAVVIADISLTVRRLHDLNLSGFWYLGLIGLGLVSGFLEGMYETETPLFLIIIINITLFIATLLLIFWPGTKGPNRFGRDPLGHGEEYAAEVFGDDVSERYYSYYPDAQTPARDAAKTTLKNETGRAGSKGTKLSYTRKK